MIRSIFDLVLIFIRHFYRRVFHDEVSLDVEQFIKNLSFVGAGTILASAFSFPFNILAGRLLGPSEYGLFTLVQSVAMFMIIPMLLGFHTALVKYNAERIDLPRQRAIISTTYILVALFTAISVVVYVVFDDTIAGIFSISGQGYYLAILFAVLFVVYTLSTETLRSLHMIRSYSQLKPFFTAIMLFSFLAFFFVFKISSFISPLFSMLLAYAVMAGVALMLLRNYLRPEFHKEWARTLHRYSIFTLMAGTSAILYLNVGKIIINMYMPVSNVGIYWAYNYSFTTIIVLVSSIFLTVFFPVASRSANKGMLFERVNKIAILYIVVGWPFVAVTGSILLRLYGKSYPFDIPLTLLFATAAIVMVIESMYIQLFNSAGVVGVKITSLASIVLAVVNVPLTFLLVPRLGLYGAIIGTIVGYVSSTGVLYFKRDQVKSMDRDGGTEPC
jgi:O-antigen/teichoic acid export membrane protein